jgi:hypothetical protein
LLFLGINPEFQEEKKRKKKKKKKEGVPRNLMSHDSSFPNTP